MIKFEVLERIRKDPNFEIKIPTNSKYVLLNVLMWILAHAGLAIMFTVLYPVYIIMLGIEKLSALYVYIVIGRKERIKRIKQTKMTMQEYEHKLLTNNNTYNLIYGTYNLIYGSTTAGFGKISMYTFIEWFLKDGNKKYFTYDSVTQQQICNTWRRRSLGDIFLICKFYYSNCTIHGVIEVLVDLLEKRGSTFRASYCNTIEKYVFHTEQDAGYVRDSKVEYSKLIRFKDIIEAYK